MNAVMEIVKKNMLSLICAVVAILAMVAVFIWPLPGKFEEVQTKANARKAEFESLDSLAKKERKLPLTDFGTNPEAKALDGFPTEKVIAKGTQLVSDITTQSKAAQDLAAQLNEHTPLVPDALPNAPTGKAYTYQQEYQRMMDFQNPDPNIRNKTIAVKILKAGVTPGEAELLAEKERRKQEIKDNEWIPNQNDAFIEAKIAQMESTIGETLRKEIASKSLMYMNPDALDIYPGVLGIGEPPKAEPIYHSQLGLWVQQDVCTALAAVNAASNAAAVAEDPKAAGIISSAVKHLIKIDVNEDSGRTGSNPGQPAEGAPTGATNLTGHASNAMYEVIPFRLTIYVDAAKVPAVLTELARNKFITVLKCDLSGVDMGTQVLAGFFYGPRPVVQLTLDCEELFLKSWLTKYMPPSIAAPPTPS
ncbi:hypothetical protein BH09PLA1_BH09PLA1_36800 [soil metagenome]